MVGSSPAKPVDCTVDFDTTHLAGKTAVVTGGSSGLGEAYVRALAKAGVTVIFGDLNVEAGEKLASELPGCHYLPCNVTTWTDQVSLFSTAARLSPSSKIDYVVANAGIIGPDDIFAFDGPDRAPKKPNLDIITVNLHGTLYTAKLAAHHFISQNGTSPHANQTDTCLVLIGSGAAFLDCPRGPQYSATKWAVRGIMHSLRRTAYYYGSRVNVISPWYVRTKILSDGDFDAVERAGVQLATTEDAGACLLRVLGDTEINGRSLFVAARKWAEKGFVDLDVDEYVGRELLEEIQEDQLRFEPVESGLFGQQGALSKES